MQTDRQERLKNLLARTNYDYDLADETDRLLINEHCDDVADRLTGMFNDMLQEFGDEFEFEDMRFD